MEKEIITLSKISQIWKDKCQVLSLIYQNKNEIERIRGLFVKRKGARSGKAKESDSLVWADDMTYMYENGIMEPITW